MKLQKKQGFVRFGQLLGLADHLTYSLNQEVTKIYLFKFFWNLGV